MNLSVTPLPLNLALYAGDDVSIGFTWTDKATGAPYPLTGEWKAHIMESDIFIMEFAVDQSGLANGQVILSLTGDQTRTLGASTGLRWDVQQTDDNGRVRTWYRGEVAVEQDVTDRPVVQPLDLVIVTTNT